MTDIILVKTHTGTLEGFRAQDRRAQARLQKIMDEMESGELITVRYWFRRNGKFHRLHMGLLRLFFDSQEGFSDEDRSREWTAIGAGHVNWIPVGEELKPVPKSIAYHEIDDEEMHKLHEATKVFLATERAQEQLWPALSPQQRSDGAMALLNEFEEPQS